MPTRRTPAPCACGACYADFRAGITFADARRMMYRASDDPKDWRQKRRRSVLGFMRELKIKFWYLAHGGCEEIIASEAA